MDKPLLFLIKLAWACRYRLPILITIGFMALDIRMQLEIHVQMRRVRRMPQIPVRGARNQNGDHGLRNRSNSDDSSSSWMTIDDDNDADEEDDDDFTSDDNAFLDDRDGENSGARMEANPLNGRHTYANLLDFNVEN